jgi:hypothetical protein
MYRNSEVKRITFIKYRLTDNFLQIRIIGKKPNQALTEVVFINNFPQNFICTAYENILGKQYKSTTQDKVSYKMHSQM